MLTEWLQIMLEEISSKQEQAQRAREEVTVREQQQIAEAPTKLMSTPDSNG